MTKQAITLHKEYTLTKTFTNGTTSTWVFGKLSTGKFGAKCLETGKKLDTFNTHERMLKCIRKYINSYGYQVPVNFNQLSLAI